MVRLKLGTTPVVEYFTNASSVSVPAGVNGVWLMMIGAGGGGGSGRKSTSGNRFGGEGGQGGNAIKKFYIPATLLGTTYTVTVSSTGGAGATAVSAANTNGNNGTGGGSTVFSTGSNTWTVSGGLGGLGGTALAQGSSQLISTSSGREYGQAGGVGGMDSGTPAAGASNGDYAGTGAAGGGGGGGINSGGTAGNGGNGGTNLILGNNVFGAAGVAGGASPTSGSAIPNGFMGSGGGGGAGNNSGVGQTGASAVGYGGGGGGGGASNGSNSGAGGNGAPGYLRLVWDYRPTRQQLGVAAYNEYSGATNASGITVPQGIKGAWVFMIGCGGAGGSGSTNLGSVTHNGGQGGYGGNITQRWVSASLLGTTYSIFIPTNRTGGTSISASTTSGNPGQAFAQSTFTSGSFTLYCDGGSPGAGGTTVLAGWPGMTTPTYTYDIQGAPGAPSGGYNAGPTDGATLATGQSNAANFDNDANGWDEYGGGGGGGPGGFVQATNSVFGGSGGGTVRSYGRDGGNPGTYTGGTPTGGTTAQSMIPGAGAGGGASLLTSFGQNGANATGYGGGGGGGGAAFNTFTSGAGGAGGPGYTRITWDYI